MHYTMYSVRIINHYSSKHCYCIQWNIVYFMYVVSTIKKQILIIYLSFKVYLDLISGLCRAIFPVYLVSPIGLPAY